MNYGASIIVAKPLGAADQVQSDQSLATEVLLGKRMPSVKVLNQSDARPWHLQEILPSNGRWRVIAFSGDINDPSQKAKIQNLAHGIDNPESFLHVHSPKGARYDEVFEILTIHNSPRQDVTIFDFPAVFRPYDEVEGWDYNKIYVDDVSYHEGFGQIYKTFNILKQGCLMILRPDQYVSYIGPLDDVDAVNKFFRKFMLVQPKA